MKSRPGYAVATWVASRLAVFLYLAALGGFLLQSAVGDSQFFPVSYFFTWDMFPSHNSQSFRRIALGETVSRRFVLLYPSPRDQFHRGAYGDLARLDLDRRVYFYRDLVEQTLREYSDRESEDPVKHVYLLEKYWPVKFNYPAAMYEAWSGTSRPDRAAWRIISEFDTVATGPSAKLMADESEGPRP